MRLASKVDRNQPEIVRALRAAGATVQHLHRVGLGCPDLLVGIRGKNYLLEIKSNGGRMTDDETIWHEWWCGQVVVVCAPEEALEVIGVELRIVK